ncbi:MAG: response regulator [bacterium]
MSKRILIIEESPESSLALRSILEPKGYEVLAACDGAEGWTIIVNERPDLVIMELRLPGMSGMEICKRVRSSAGLAETPLIIVTSMTANSGKPESYWASGLGCDDFITKPFDALNILGRVECQLRRGQYISAAQAPGAAAVKSSAPHPATFDDPGEVVRVFIESWNTRAFAREYDTLGEEMLGGVGREEYVRRRAQLYADEQGENTTRKALDVYVNISHNVAKVDCLREDATSGVARAKDERYALKKTPGGWKIISVRSDPIQFSIE